VHPGALAAGRPAARPGVHARGLGESSAPRHRRSITRQKASGAAAGDPQRCTVCVAAPSASALPQTLHEQATQPRRFPARASRATGQLEHTSSVGGAATPIDNISMARVMVPCVWPNTPPASSSAAAARARSANSCAACLTRSILAVAPAGSARTLECSAVQARQGLHFFEAVPAWVQTAPTSGGRTHLSERRGPSTAQERSPLPPSLDLLASARGASSSRSPPVRPLRAHARSGSQLAVSKVETVYIGISGRHGAEAAELCA